MNFIEFFLNLPLLSQIIIIYAFFINIISFFYFGLDKLKSQLGSWRISEKTLWVLALIGGSLGSMFGMYFFRHKTKKSSFKITLGVIILVHLGLLFYLLVVN